MTKFRMADPEKPLIAVETIVNGKGPFNFVIDTGASHSVISNQTAEKLGLSGNTSCCGSKAKRSAQGAGGPVATHTITVESVKVDDVEVRDIEVALVDLAPLSKTWDGIIGYNFMKDYKVIINYPKREISFEKS